MRQLIYLFALIGSFAVMAQPQPTDDLLKLPVGTELAFGNSAGLSFPHNPDSDGNAAALSFGSDNSYCNVTLRQDVVKHVDLSGRKFRVASVSASQDLDVNGGWYFQGTAISVVEVNKDGSVAKAPIDNIFCVSNPNTRKVCQMHGDEVLGEFCPEITSSSHPTIRDFKRAFLQPGVFTKTTLKQLANITGYKVWKMTSDDHLMTVNYPTNMNTASNPATAQEADQQPVGATN